MDKLAEKMNELPKFLDTDRESDLGYIYGVSGPGKTYKNKLVKNELLNK